MDTTISLPERTQVALTRFDRWWASLMPPVLKKFLPPWQISAGLVTIAAFSTEDPFLTTALWLFWASITFTWFFAKLRRYIGHLHWMIPFYHIGLTFLIVNPVTAQSASGSACTTSGLFATLTNFVNTLFSAVTFGGVGGGTLSNLICQVIGFLTIGILLAILASLAYVSYQVGYSKQPVSTVLEPLMAFLIFAGGSTVAIGVMIGTSTPTTTI